MTERNSCESRSLDPANVTEPRNIKRKHKLKGLRPFFCSRFRRLLSASAAAAAAVHAIALSYLSIPSLAPTRERIGFRLNFAFHFFSFVFPVRIQWRERVRAAFSLFSEWKTLSRSRDRKRVSRFSYWDKSPVISWKAASSCFSFYFFFAGKISHQSLLSFISFIRVYLSRVAAPLYHQECVKQSLCVPSYTCHSDKRNFARVHLHRSER